MRNMNCPPEAEVLYIDRPQPIYWICGPPCHLWDSSRISAYSEIMHCIMRKLGSGLSKPTFRRSHELYQRVRAGVPVINCFFRAVRGHILPCQRVSFGVSQVAELLASQQV